jgi:hypothetical protein
MTGYVRTDTSNNIADGNVINAADFDLEFDAVVAGFHATTGHKHDGTAAEGAPITKVGPTQDVVVSASTITPKTTNVVDVGSSALKFKDVYLTGTVNAASFTASQAIFTDGSKNLVSNAITGTGNVVMSTSPTLVTPILGTPTSATLTNATGLPVSTGISGLGTGVATLLATPSSANLAAAVTDETGSGSLVFATSPTLVTPALGTPSSVTLTNATGLPVATGISGLGTGVATFLATPSSANLLGAVTDETGTGSLVFATSPTLVTPILGTPTSATLTNATGLPLTTGVTGLLPIANGGTATSTPSLVQGANVTITGTWPNQTIAAAAPGTGTVTSASVVSANGFAGTVATATSTPAITISTSITGVLKGNGTAISAATAGTDYVTPTGTETLTNKTLTSPTLTTPVLGTPSSGTLSSCTVDGTNSVGYLNIPQNSQSAAYTLVLADAGKHIFHPSTDANARTFTIPANSSVAYPIGTAISFINMTSQVVSIAITSDTMYLSSAGTTGTRSLAQYGTATCVKMTSTTWIISGSGLT